MRAWMSGSSRATHISFGAVKPGRGRTPEMRPISGRASRRCRQSSLERLSFHRIAGRRTDLSLSRRTAPCIWPDNPTAVISDNRTAVPRSATAAQVAVHHACGSCSDHPGLGDWTVRSAVAVARIRSSSVQRTLTAEVPISMPKNMAQQYVSANTDASLVELVCRHSSG